MGTLQFLIIRSIPVKGIGFYPFIHLYEKGVIQYLRGISGGAGNGMKRLLLRSHLSPRIDDFKTLYLNEATRS